MDNLVWIASVGGLLLLVSLTSGWIRRLPLSAFSLYLAGGVVAGPWVFNFLHVDLAGHAIWMARTTEMALVASLFLGGLKLRARFNDPVWRTAWRLAVPAMAITVAVTGLILHGAFALPWPLAFLVGAIVAPTDPVLASMVAVTDASDHDRLRVALSGEAGLNDGTALPLVLLALAAMEEPLSGPAVLAWFSEDFVWSLLGGLCIGFALGWVLGWVGVSLRARTQSRAPNDFLALAIVALSYAGAMALSASGFLAAFAAGLGLRHVELFVVGHHPHPQVEGRTRPHPPAEELVNPNERETADDPAASVGMVVSDALSFGDTLEQLIAGALVILLGAAFATYWQPAGLLLALILFVIVRPVAVGLSMIGSPTPIPRRLLIGWLGIRGIGSLNYLAYAATHGLTAVQTDRAAGLVITVVAMSILVHGMTTPSLMSWRRNAMNKRTSSTSPE